ncbi:hypothetical protein N7493_009797 [Penicillium malachiteum]|uniref:L-type lectin-like domain-containing protein n=1 Tax=Penicillium malachiteum TaxID=1324776 RepID=A0AAD6HF00_9EURO|nr:hypothetical protein N7493_009797 [Penicillium malachiteum]
MDFTDVGIRHTLLNSVELRHFIDFSPSAAVISKEIRICVIAVVVGWITTREKWKRLLLLRISHDPFLNTTTTSMKVFASLALLAAGATAQIIESASFGYGKTISPTRDSIPGWNINGENFDPSLLSDKLIITPPYPGNVRGSAWAQSPVALSEWSAEFQFRASGPERASGNLQLWYTKDGEARVGTSSIYTVGPFDGFALVIDTHGGRGGSIRGFLNDGTTDYRTHRSVDSLAFGHCDYPYRNLGRPSVVKLKHTSSFFEVTVDDKVCFSTDKVVLPSRNTFRSHRRYPRGTPIPSEVFKFVLESASRARRSLKETPTSNSSSSKLLEFKMPHRLPQAGSDKDYSTQFFDPEQPYPVTEQGHQRHSTRNQSPRPLRVKIVKPRLIEFSHQGTKSLLLEARLQRIESMLQNIRRDLEGKDYSSRFNQLQDTLRTSHLSLTENLHGHLLNGKFTRKQKKITCYYRSTPRMGFFIFLIIAFQIFLAVAYVVYKRRRANMPKKFL